MPVRFIIEESLKLSRFKQAKLVKNYNERGAVDLPKDAVVKSIQQVGKDTIIVVGKPIQSAAPEATV